jgi:hypothetical protein
MGPGTTSHRAAKVRREGDGRRASRDVGLRERGTRIAIAAGAEPRGQRHGAPVDDENHFLLRCEQLELPGEPWNGLAMGR